MRCLVLADALKMQGWNTLFVSRNLPGNLFSIIKKRLHNLVKLPSIDNYLHGHVNHNDYLANLGVPWQQDAKETTEVIKSMAIKPDWLIVDHYSLHGQWERQLRAFVKKIFVIDDLVEHTHDCDYLLNQDYLPDADDMYKKLIPKDAKIFLGPKYALIQPVFKEVRKKINKRKGSINRFLVFYGGSDLTNETNKALMAIEKLNRRDINVDVVISSSNIHKKTIQKLVGQMSGARLHIQLKHLADLMVKADLYIGAGGTTVLECLCLGLPSLITIVAENQNSSIRFLHDQGHLTCLGDVKTVGMDDILYALRRMLDDPDRISKQSKESMKMVDGKGTDRLVKSLMAVSLV